MKVLTVVSLVLVVVMTVYVYLILITNCSNGNISSLTPEYCVFLIENYDLLRNLCEDSEKMWLFSPKDCYNSINSLILARNDISCLR